MFGTVALLLIFSFNKKIKKLPVNVKTNYLFSALGRSVGQDLAVMLTSKSTCSLMFTSGHSSGSEFFILMQFGERGL